MCPAGEAAGAWCDPMTETTAASSTNRKYKCPDCAKKEKEGSGKDKKDRDRRDEDEGKGQKSGGHDNRRREIGVHTINQ